MEQTNNIGRGIEGIIQPATKKSEESEEIRSAEAVSAIIRILSGLPDAQVQNVFDAVAAIRTTANRSRNEISQIGENLHRLERERRKRENEGGKRWYWPW